MDRINFNKCKYLKREREREKKKKGIKLPICESGRTVWFVLNGFHV